MSDKKISIITTTYQDVSHLKKVVEGIKNQDYPNLEYIIVDGGSTDGTVEYLKELEKDFSYGWPEREVKWISEKDNGIYDALNKGIAWQPVISSVLCLINFPTLMFCPI